MNFLYDENRIYLQNEKGETTAEICFRLDEEGNADIFRTFVDESLRGQGIADKLMMAMVQKLQQENCKATLTCPYAIKWMDKHPEYAALRK